MRIQEGRLAERVCPHCGGVERRAFGEAVSDRGELASYALGWTSGHEDHVAHMTVGIGAGNPGGGSFHIEVRVVDERSAMTLVDRPFEDVPEGGPDLTREQALVHEALRFIWFVADNVMVKDRRAWWMETWLRQTTALATPPVVDGSEPVLWVVHDRDDQWWLFERHQADRGDARLLHLFHALDRDPSLLDALDLEPGHSARRRKAGARWKRRRPARS